MGVRLSGTVKWFNSKKGFGFIVAKVKEEDSEEQEVFVHQTSILCDDVKCFRTLVSKLLLACLCTLVNHPSDLLTVL